MYRKHERCSKIFSLVTGVLILWHSLLFSQFLNNDILYQYETKIKENSMVLDSIKLKLEQGRKKINELGKKEGVYLEQLELLEKNIEGTVLYVEKTSERIDTLKIHTKALEDSLKTVSGDLVFRQEKMKKRLVNLYKTGRPSVLEIILTSGTILDILYKAKYFQELNSYEKVLAQSIDSTRISVQKNKHLLEIEQEQLLTLKRNKEEEKQQLKKKQKQRKQVLDNVKKEKKAYLSMIKELELAQKELNTLVENLEKKRIEAKIDYEQGQDIAFDERMGKLPWPVNGTVIKNFGKIIHPIYNTVTMSDGIDIEAMKGNRVFCVAPGKVYYIGWMRGYGKFILINHGGYITMYAHLDHISVTQDQTLQYGSEIGLVGETGSLNGPKLHFQIRQSTTSKTLDPLEWLEKKE